ncbi:hypothetical protein GCM10022409_47910 [Hymenobacter glaciei]|uniref:Uncharacterized protein n=1 Tax=Hymenobacter glaciei TaxID=877209 RepID=A0ABP7UXN0_9BACT
MRHTYIPVCSLAQQHTYFQQPATASVRFAPTPDTAEKLRRAGLLLKATELGLLLLRALPVPEPDETPAPARPLPDFLFPLRFAVQPISPYFWNFTALPEQSAPGPPSRIPSIQYFRVEAAPPDGSLTLTVPDARPLPLTTLALSVPAPRADAIAGKVDEAEIRDVVRDKALPASMAQKNALGLNIDLRPWGAGHYQLQRHGQELLECYADDQLHAAQAWAVLEIAQGALAAGPLNIVFAFEGRRTRWRYLVRYRPTTDPAPVIPENASIKVKMAKADKVKAVKDDQAKPAKNDGPPSPVSFAVPKQLPATGPAADLVFESDVALPLAERPVVACTLHYTLHGTPVEVALPAAQGDVLCRPGPDPQQPAFSEIMVLL